MQLGCGCGCLLVLIFLIACGFLGFGFAIYQNPIVIVWLILIAILSYISNEIYKNNALFGYDLGLTKSQKNITTGLFALLMVIVTGVCGLVIYVGQQKEEARLNNEAKVIYEEIQADYEQGNYDKVSDDFKKLDKYKKTAYAQKAKQDFGDYDDKLEEQKKEKAERELAEKKEEEAKKKAERDEEEREIQADWKARGQEVMDAFTNLFRNNLYKDMFVTASANSSEMTVVVNDYWHHCSKDIKKDFIKSVVVSWCGMHNVRGMKTSDIERWHFTFVHNISGRTLATYDNVWGPSLND